MDQLELPPHVGVRARPLRIGLLGCGTVGSEVMRLLHDAAPIGTCLVRVAVRNPHKPRPLAVPKNELTDVALAVVKDPDIDMIVELIGGLEPAHGLIRQALAEGKHVVTANKAVLGRRFVPLRRAALERDVSLLFEGAVGGAIPIVRLLRTASPGDRVRSLTAVLNGTTNFVLGEMEKGMSFETALTHARESGYAEADATDDIEGRDAACKVALLASLAFDVDLALESVAHEGIDKISRRQIRASLGRGRRLKLVATTERASDGSVTARVGPAALSPDHPLARLEGVENGIVVERECSGRLSFYGPGAGGRPTAAAVMADIEEIARKHAARAADPIRSAPLEKEAM